MEKITKSCGYSSFPFLFTPEKTEIYTIRSLGTEDTFGYLYDMDQTELTENDDANSDENDYNFLINYELEAGETYYIAVQFYDAEKVGSFRLMIYTPVSETSGIISGMKFTIQETGTVRRT